jgi:hypothetical protein
MVNHRHSMPVKLGLTFTISCPQALATGALYEKIRKLACLKLDSEGASIVVDIIAYKRKKMPKRS